MAGETDEANLALLFGCGKRLQKFRLVLRRQVNHVCGILRQNHDRRAFREIEPLDDNLAVHDGTGGYLHG